ncbi:unnamed protein product [Leptosia nina]|uniref:Major facilitator superfamily (MFS) profile domain-containing protein n=1 Tax=Leptosia nina TaxID=320188 RepID=A0AAV1ITF3_9NEOP
MNISTAFLKQLWLTIGASLAFLIIGLVRGYTASGLPSIEQYNPSLIGSSEQKSWIGSIAPLGAFLGSMCSGPLMQRAGRKRTLQLTAPLWTAGWLILGFAPIFPIVLLGRLIAGLCVGFVLAPVQVYVSECCDPEIRGRLGSLPTLSMSFGILISYIAGSWLYWRYLAFLSATFCAALFVILLPLPESPVWLDTQGLNNTASMKWLHLSKHAVAAVKDDIPEPVKSVTGSFVKPAEAEPKSLFTREVFFSSSVIKPLIIGFALLFFQQFSGIDAVIFFTVEIFQKAGSKLDAMTATIIVGVVQLFSNAISTVLVDRAGRRPLLLLSAATMCMSMIAMGTSFFFNFEKESWLGYLPIASLVIYMLGFSLGFGGLPFLLLGELFPKHYRSQLSGMASAVNLFSMFSVIKSYHALDHVLTSAGTFWLYAAFCGAAFFFVAFFVPETKGKSLAEIEQHFRGHATEKNKLVSFVIFTNRRIQYIQITIGWQYFVTNNIGVIPEYSAAHAQLKWTFCLTALVWTTSKCEPPVNSYLPPGSGSGSGPSSQYGTPGVGGQRGLSSQRFQNQGPGSRQSLSPEYGVPGQAAGFPRGSQRGFGQDNLPNSEYGAPNGLSRQTALGGVNQPQTSYGTPFQSGNNPFGARNSQRPDTSYGTPSNGFQSPEDFGSDGFTSRGSSRVGGRGRQPQRGSPSSSYGTPDFGNDLDGRNENYRASGVDGSSEPAKYQFSYQVDDAETGTQFGHSEQRDGDVAIGEYNVLLPDGRKQIVEYEADQEGYKPQIRYEGDASGSGSGFGLGGGRGGNLRGGNQGYPRGGANAEAFAGADAGYPRGPNSQGGLGGFGQNGPSGQNGNYPDSGYPGRRGQGQRGSGFESGNDADGYPSGGPNGPRGSGY